MDYILQLKRIKKQFDEHLVLNNVNLNIEPGKIHAILGENGAGKSTLVKIIAGEIQQDGGDIYFDTKKVVLSSALRAHQIGITIMHQEVNLALKMSVVENIFMGKLPYKQIGPLKIIDWEKVRKTCYELFEAFDYQFNLRKPVEKLGMGERRIVEIMKAFCQQSKVLVFDESMERLTESETKLVFELIKKSKAAGAAIVFISHNIKDIASIADTISILHDGTITDTFENKPDIYEDLFYYLDHKYVMNRYPKIKTEIGQTLLSVKNIYAGKFINGVTLDVKKGEIVGIYGLVGSGRTAIAEALVGLNPITSGTVCLNNKQVKINSPKNALKNGICLVCEDRDKGLVQTLSVAHNISLSNFKGVTTHYIIDTALEKRIAEAYQKKLGIQLEKTHQPVKYLSGGGKQKTMIAKCLFTHPQVIILDEPTAGLDAVSKVEIYNLINELILQGVAVLLISSDLCEIQGMCDRVYVISHGVVAKELKRDDLTERNILGPCVGRI